MQRAILRCEIRHYSSSFLLLFKKSANFLISLSSSSVYSSPSKCAAIVVIGSELEVIENSFVSPVLNFES